ncbi:4903_t:CDS:1, partial [Diversispora eburnea]
EDLGDSDEIEFAKNQNVELDLILDLQSNSIIALSDSTGIPSENIMDNEQHLSIESSKITTQSSIHLFRNTIRSGHEEILSWISLFK